MKWKRKSEVTEMYCAVHNVDCPLHGHPGDPWVLSVSPNSIPEPWVCPQAVTEIAEYAEQAEERSDTNQRIER